jgi:DNA-binding CsgD family transcriptional regulator/PAS domain-containing protein
VSRVARIDGIVSGPDLGLDDAILAVYRAAEQPASLARWIETHAEDVRRSRALRRHVRQAQRLQGRLATLSADRSAALALLERMPMAAVILDQSGRPIAANAAAGRLAAKRGSVTIGADGITANTPEGQRELAAAIRSVMPSSGARPTRQAEALLSISNGPGRRPVAVLVVPVNRAGAAAAAVSQAAAAVFIGDLDAHAPADVNRLAQCFRLTAAEARIAIGLTDGRSVNDLATDLKLSRNTIRWHVKHLLQKTGVKTQAQFVRLVYRSPATLP